ncbi:GDP-mannose 4,6-dehydratase [Hymenobacter sp. BT683]|uniref:GDP-mannose 4,6-dehydratase n=1 Tax=Hymenobacter jeongseonensis TaxID=2791027 RepID=A0ABS0IHU1_9BACT|nr:NAD-dependent epimerase/dehydratase family protein [Hymenobacter jeongseonensis]MBF9237916.1 GDP-mannose 4,6-dehydratase [Hymenobacter jeongseonensis]
MATILVTGCAGFIGSHLCERLLAEGYGVVGLDNFDPFYSRRAKAENLALLQFHPHFSFFELDLRHGPAALAALPPGPYSAVVHLAAKAGVGPSLREPAAYIDTNVLGTTHLLEWMHQQQVPNLLFASSSSVYGNTLALPFHEDEPLSAHCISPYAASKLAGEELTFTYHHLYGLNVLNARFFTVYGPRQRPDLAIHKFAGLLRAGQPLPVYGDGSSARDYTYIDDIVDGIRRSLTYLEAHPDTYEIVNLGNSHPIPLLELIAALGQSIGIEPRLDFLPAQAGDVAVTFADIRKAQRLLGYAPGTTLSYGLRQFVRWLDATAGATVHRAPSTWGNP